MAATAAKFARLAALRPSRVDGAPPARLRAPEEGDVIARLLGAEVGQNKYGEHLAVRNWFSTPECSIPTSRALELLARTRDAELSRRHCAALENAENWLFLDTETTGLAGGTGTYAFLIGLAWWDAGGLQVEQLLMRDFAEEHSVLQELSSRIAERPVLVTFNGKCFDWPLLESRFTMTRKIPVPRLAMHLDLLHPARALWKLRLGSVRLVELERHVLDAARLGWHRENDISSAMIPQYYFDYLRGGTPQPLAAVVRHNEMDLRGLAALYGKINAMLEAEGEDEADSRDLFGLARYLQRRGEAVRAHDTCERALDAGLPAEIRPQARRELALMAKRRGEYERAAEIWHEMLGDAEDAAQACEQLAIYYERRVKDILRAIEFAELGAAKLRQLLGRTRDPLLAARMRRMEDKFEARLERLARRGPAMCGRRLEPRRRATEIPR